ncbi:MAG TPA: hypothetical protein VKE27_02610, partial [Candidatus Dormibacteraeota bacterium]|nr:hypothetical protein [Candidatus Dormibacteraeota bacterium]
MNCPVCSAPALPIDDACVFCHAPLVERDEPHELLDYLVERIPIAQARRGHLNRGPITEVSIEFGGRSFHARFRNEALELKPAVEVAAWVDLLLTKLSDAAAVNHDLRRAVLRSGWA